MLSEIVLLVASSLGFTSQARFDFSLLTTASISMYLKILYIRSIYLPTGYSMDGVKGNARGPG